MIHSLMAPNIIAVGMRAQDRDNSCDLIICDEAHRLKNDKTLTTQVRCCALPPPHSLSVVRRACTVG